MPRKKKEKVTVVNYRDIDPEEQRKRQRRKAREKAAGPTATPGETYKANKLVKAERAQNARTQTLADVKPDKPFREKSSKVRNPAAQKEQAARLKKAKVAVAKQKRKEASAPKGKTVGQAGAERIAKIRADRKKKKKKK